MTRLRKILFTHPRFPHHSNLSPTSPRCLVGAHGRVLSHVQYRVRVSGRMERVRSTRSNLGALLSNLTFAMVGNM